MEKQTNHDRAAEDPRVLVCRRAVVKKCGAIVYGRPLWELLGKGAQSTLRGAIRRGEFKDLRLRSIPGKRGVYAEAKDLAKFLVNNGIDWEARLKNIDRFTYIPTRRRRPVMGP